MSGAAELVAALRDQGVRLIAEGEKLHLVAPPGILTDEVKAQLRSYKAEVLRLVEGGQNDLTESDQYCL